MRDASSSSTPTRQCISSFSKIANSAAQTERELGARLQASPRKQSVMTFPYRSHSICGVISRLGPVASYETPHADGDYCNTRLRVCKAAVNLMHTEWRACMYTVLNHHAVRIARLDQSPQAQACLSAACLLIICISILREWRFSHHLNRHDVIRL
jgi:hypothetical protein